MSPRHAPSRAKWLDCREPGAQAELLLVEGDSALSSVAAVRNERTQGVMAFQGKPLNAWAAPAERVDRHAQYRLLADALGLAAPTSTLSLPALEGLRYGRVGLLFDPDADGIHIGALVMLFVQRWWPALIDTGRLWLLRAPMYELVSADDGEVQQAEHPGQLHALSEQMRLSSGGREPMVRAYRGLGSIAPAVLRERCVDPVTRRGYALSAAEVQTVAAVFGGAGSR